MKALIIDDEIDICYLLSGLLTKKNVKPQYVNTIGEALKVLEKTHPQIIFLDNHLPDGRGVDLIRYIKGHLPETKLVMITAYDSTEERRKAISEGVDYFVPKPFSGEKINQAMDAIMN